MSIFKTRSDEILKQIVLSDPPKSLRVAEGGGFVVDPKEIRETKEYKRLVNKKSKKES